MKSCKALLFAIGLALFTVGCGGGLDTTATEEEKAEMNAQMEADMAKMTGKVSEKPGAGTPAPGAK